MPDQPVHCEYEMLNRQLCGKPAVARWRDSVTGDWFVVCTKHDANAVLKAPARWQREPLAQGANT